MIIYVDIDNTICSHEEDYSKAIPFHDMIDKVNKLSEEHTVIYWTARGATTGIDWTDVTEKQLQKWGCKYSELKMGKPHYDLFICDKSITPEVL